jgi:hypothetical protein
MRTRGLYAGPVAPGIAQVFRVLAQLGPRIPYSKLCLAVDLSAITRCRPHVEVIDVPGIFAHVFANKVPALLARKSRGPL